MTKYKLGLRPIVTPVKLKLGNYVNLSTLPVPPPEVDWSLALTSDWSILGNGPDPLNPPAVADGVGDCFFAAAVERIRCVTANAQAAQAALGTADALKAYTLCTGFDPNDPSTDNGTEPGQGFLFLQNTGVSGHKFGPIVQIDVRNESLVRAAQWLLCGLMVGVRFPQDWELAPEWDVTNSPIVGGHEIFNFGYGTDQKLFGPIVTWGLVRQLTWSAAAQNITQLTGSVPQEWIGDNGLAPNGFDLEALLADAQAMGA
jgi:hypothetical protein